MEQWIGEKVLEVDFSGGNPKIEHLNIEDSSFNIKSAACIFELINRYTIKRSEHAEKIELGHSTHFRITPDETPKLEYFSRGVRRLESLFSIFYGEPTYAIEIKLSSVSPTDHEDNQNVLLRYCRKPRDLKVPDRFNMRFKYPSIKEHYEKTLDGVLSLTDGMNIALNMIAHLYREEYEYLDQLFIPAIQAIEIFSRSDGKQLYMGKSDHDQVYRTMVESIPEGIDSDFKQSLKNRLKYSNEYSLRKRLKTLMSQLSTESLDLVCNSVDNFIAGVVDTRNHLTHYSYEQDRCLQGVELLWAARKLRHLVTIIFLMQLGIPESVVCDQMKPTAHRDKGAWKGISEIGTVLE